MLMAGHQWGLCCAGPNVCDWAVSHPKIPPGLKEKLSPKQSHSWGLGQLKPQQAGRRGKMPLKPEM